ncbi:MAG: NAD(+) diphosphatase [Salaquimonas sp.]|nr:NAD(+) diphosphatase [Salaquimonas sp.]
MSIDFDSLPLPEPSSLTGFAGNSIVRDSEKRSETSLAEAAADPACRCYLFLPGKAVFGKAAAEGETAQILYTVSEAKKLGGKLDQAILLGHEDGAPRLAVRLGVEAEALGEAYEALDFRSVLYAKQANEGDLAAIAQAGSMMHWHTMNRFCGKCGHESQPAIGGYRRDCLNCGSQIFPRTDPVVIMLTIDGDKCLLGRSPHFPPDWFSTLAGFVEPGETIEDAVRRETFEESGIRIGRVRYHASQPWPFPHSLMIGAFGEAVSHEIKVDDELEDCRWFTREEVRQMIAGEHPEGLRCPPRKAIAYSLVSAWALD